MSKSRSCLERGYCWPEKATVIILKQYGVPDNNDNTYDELKRDVDDIEDDDKCNEWQRGQP